MPPLLFFFLSGFPQHGTCGRFPAKDFSESKSPRWQRRYSNYAYGYRVRLPRGVTAYGEAPPIPAHGVSIVLSWEPRSYLYIDGSYNSLSLANSFAVAEMYEGFVRDEALAIQSVKRRRTRLGPYAAVRLTARHTCGSSSHFVTDEITMLRWGKVFTISITTPAGRYRRDLAAFNQIARSFRLLSNNRGLLKGL